MPDEQQPAGDALPFNNRDLIFTYQCSSDLSRSPSTTVEAAADLFGSCIQRSTSSITQQRHRQNEQPFSGKQALTLLTMYLAAVVHDFDHRGVNNQFLIRSVDPLALRYNDVSPMENHHVSAAFTAMREEQYNFLGRASREVGGSSACLLRQED